MEVTIVKLTEETVDIQFRKGEVVSPVYQMKSGDKLDLGGDSLSENETESA